MLSPFTMESTQQLDESSVCFRDVFSFPDVFWLDTLNCLSEVHILSSYIQLLCLISSEFVTDR